MKKSSKKNVEELVNKYQKANLDCLLEIEYNENLPNGYVKNFIKVLQSQPNYNEIKDKYIFDEEKNILICILEKTPLSEIEGLTAEERFFYPLCNKAEIKRIFNLENAEDYLLKYRAEQIIGNIRLNKVFTSIRQKSKNWKFSEYFSSDLFSNYLSKLPEKEYSVCKNIAFGTIYLKDANGYCMKTKYGNIVVISFALKYFIYYMNLFHFGSQIGIEENDTNHSLMIAIRTMFGSEALDFEIDTRGEIPTNVHIALSYQTDMQMLFVIGHEFAHHYLNHLEKGSAKYLNLTDTENGNEMPFYNYAEQLELEADYHSIMTPILSEHERSELADSAFLFFMWLDIYQSVNDYCRPSGSNFRTHPEPINRIRELRKRLNPKFGTSLEKLNMQINYFAALKEHLIKEVLPFNIEDIETYGSTYLPSFKKAVSHDKLNF